MQTKLYRISGFQDNFSFCEYECPKLGENFNTEIPNVVSNILLSNDKIEEFHENGLINDKIYDYLLDGRFKINFYFVATKNDEDDFWLCNQIKLENKKLTGRLPVRFDLYKRKIFVAVYVIFYILFVYWLISTLL